MTESSTAVETPFFPTSRVKSYFPTKFVDMDALSPDTKKMVTQYIQSRQGAANFPGYISRNTPCPCGSGQRFKRCCQSK